MKTILIPTDFSKNSFHSAIYGSILAKQLNADIVFLHIYSLPIMAENDLSFNTESMLENFQNLAKEKMEMFINKFINESKFPAEKISNIIDFGFVADKIVEVSEEINAFFIVIGNKGITNAFDHWIGNIALKIKNQANCPVWVVPEKAQLKYPKDIVYAADFVGKEENSIKILLSIANLFDANCTAVHIHEEFELNLGHKIELTISKLQDLFHHEKISFTSYKSDDAIGGLEKYLKKNKPDILSLSIHEQSIFDKIFEVSVSKHFVLEANLPILCFKK